jgi:hypothetical protein
MVLQFVTFVYAYLCVCAYVHGNYEQRRSRVTGALWQPRDWQHAILSVVQHLRHITTSQHRHHTKQDRKAVESARSNGPKSPTCRPALCPSGLPVLASIIPCTCHAAPFVNALRHKMLVFSGCRSIPFLVARVSANSSGHHSPSSLGSDSPYLSNSDFTQPRCARAQATQRHGSHLLNGQHLSQNAQRCVSA